jgi:hypothetical protein
MNNVCIVQILTFSPNFLFLSMNKNLVLISSIGLFLAVVHNPPYFFSVSHCVHEGMQNFRHGGVVFGTFIFFSSSVSKSKSTCSVLEFDSHFHNFATSTIFLH